MDTITLAMSKAFTRRTIKDIEVSESMGNIPIAYTLPTEAKEGDLLLYPPINEITTMNSEGKIYFDWDELREKYISGDENNPELHCNFGGNFNDGEVEEYLSFGASRSDTYYGIYFEASGYNVNTKEDYNK
jgi:hypothetical protein